MTLIANFNCSFFQTSAVKVYLKPSRKNPKFLFLPLCSLLVRLKILHLNLFYFTLHTVYTKLCTALWIIWSNTNIYAHYFNFKMFSNCNYVFFPIHQSCVSNISNDVWSPVFIWHFLKLFWCFFKVPFQLFMLILVQITHYL